MTYSTTTEVRTPPNWAALDNPELLNIQMLGVIRLLHLTDGNSTLTQLARDLARQLGTSGCDTFQMTAHINLGVWEQNKSTLAQHLDVDLSILELATIPIQVTVGPGNGTTNAVSWSPRLDSPTQRLRVWALLSKMHFEQTLAPELLAVLAGHGLTPELLVDQLGALALWEQDHTVQLTVADLADYDELVTRVHRLNENGPFDALDPFTPPTSLTSLAVPTTAS